MSFGYLWMSFGCLLDVSWLSFGCLLAVFWMSFGYLLDVFWISLRLLDDLKKYQELALIAVTQKKSAKGTYISKQTYIFITVLICHTSISFHLPSIKLQILTNSRCGLRCLHRGAVLSLRFEATEISDGFRRF